MSFHGLKYASKTASIFDFLEFVIRENSENL